MIGPSEDVEVCVRRYHLTREADNEGYALTVHSHTEHDPALISTLIELDLLTYPEPTFSRYTLGAFLRHGRVFTIHADKLVIGACHCLRQFDRPEEVVLFNMALRPGWRGHGLGTYLLEEVLARLEREGFQRVVLQVGASNSRAIRVYRDRFGFDHLATHCNEYGNEHDYLEMSVELAGLQAKIQALRDQERARLASDDDDDAAAVKRASTP